MKKLFLAFIMCAAFTNICMAKAKINESVTKPPEISAKMLQGTWSLGNDKITFCENRVYIQDGAEGDEGTFIVRGNMVIYQNDIDKVYGDYQEFTVKIIDRNTIKVTFDKDGKDFVILKKDDSIDLLK